MKPQTLLWWLLLCALILLGLTALGFEQHFSNFQSRWISQWGQEISADPKKWEDVRVNGVGAFSYWMDLDLGHGFTLLTARILHLALLGLALQLGLTLFLTKRKIRRASDSERPKEK